MFRDAFTKLDLLEIESVLGDVNPLLGGAAFDPRNATLLAMPLSFYTQARFLDISDHSINPPRRIYAVETPAGVSILDWTNRPIYALNAQNKPFFNESSVLEYVRFFFSLVRGPRGRFQIVESIDDIAWKDEPPPTARKAIGNLIEPVRIVGTDPDGTWHLSVRLLFRDSLFRARVAVHADGIVDMDDEELVIEDMPVYDEIFG